MKSFEERILVARKFVEEWSGRGQEDEDDQTFWNQFLQEVMDVPRVHHEIDYQKKVSVGRSTKRIDAYIRSSKTLIEQKSLGVDLDKPQTQSDGMPLTPYEQAERYGRYLSPADCPNFIIVSNFKSFRIYDCRTGFNNEYQQIALEELPNHLYLFNFIHEEIHTALEREEKANREAAKRIGELYRWFKGQYPNPDESRHDLAVLMVRILFCLYAEDSGLFDENQFTLYLRSRMSELDMMRSALINVFVVLSTPNDQRMSNLNFNDALRLFPYVNGGLFEGEIRIPQFTEEIKLNLMNCAEHFNWSGISPVIFGSIFESILSGDERRTGGMHYTSVANIHKVIDPLFLDAFRSELNAAGSNRQNLLAFQEKMAGMKFLDPACGSGNFLTQTYLDMRAMENEILRRLIIDHPGTTFDAKSFIKVNVGQFYGIEINDFAVSVAGTALWIADHQANQEINSILDQPYINLPLKKLHNIICENALCYDWEQLLPAGECNFVMGNPPFNGGKLMSGAQRKELADLYGKIPLVHSIDYVSGWYYKAAEYMMANPEIRTALVSTNSITQGQQVYPIWNALFSRFKIEIIFAWRTFIWDSEATEKAHVHVVVIGFSVKSMKRKLLFDGEDVKRVAHINPYLVEAPDVLVATAAKPICSGVPECDYGSLVNDGGQYIFKENELAEFLRAEPKAKQYIRPLIGSEEFINNKKRFILYLRDASPSELRNMPEVLKRIAAVRETRSRSSAAATRETAGTPTQFYFDSTCDNEFLLIPSTSSERRRYVPIGFVPGGHVTTNSVSIIPTATLYHFGILTSQVHNAWMRAVAGRLEMRYRYSPKTVYNTFIWPDTTDEQKQEIERLAQAVLDVRTNYLESSLADLYDPLTMPPVLHSAHKALDNAVERAYDVCFNGDEEKIVAHLFQLYAQATQSQAQ